MKKFISLALASAAMCAAAPAFASAVNIDLTAVGIAQQQNGSVNQAAASGAVAVGGIANSNEISSTAVAAGQLASETTDVAQYAGLGNLAVETSSTNQLINGTTNQLALSLAGSGSQGIANKTTSVAAAIGQSSTVSVTVKQN